MLPELDAPDDQTIEEETARETSLHLWRALNAGTSYEKLAAALRDEYDGQLERATADVDAFLAALRAQGLPSS